MPPNVQRVLRDQFAAKKASASAGNIGSSSAGTLVAPGGSSGAASGSWVAGGGEDADFRLGPVASSLFSIVRIVFDLKSSVYFRLFTHPLV